MKRLPLVSYEGGERKVIGEAVVHEDGTVEGKITEEVTLDGALEAGMVFGASLGEPGPFGRPGLKEYSHKRGVW